MSRQRSRDSWWTEQTGGMPHWAILVSALFVVTILAWALLTMPQRSAAEPDASRSPRPVPTFYSGTTTETPTDIEFPRQADGSIGAVFLGDSLTYGLFASSEDAGYRPQVVNALSAVAPVNASRGGQTGNTVATVSESSEIPADTGLVVLALGTNDVWNTPVPDYTAQYKALIEKVRTSAPDAVLVCLSVWANPDGARDYNPPISAACEAAGGTYVLISDLFDTEGMRGPSGVEAFGGTSDDFHPSDAGYAAIADRVTAALQLQ